jgi:hypothetical protein
MTSFDRRGRYDRQADREIIVRGWRHFQLGVPARYRTSF